MGFNAKNAEALEKARRGNPLRSSAKTSAHSAFDRLFQVIKLVVAGLRRRGGQQIHGKRSQPVLAFIIAAGHVFEPGARVGCGRARENPPRRIASRQSVRDAAHTPGAAQIKSVEVHQFWIAAVSHNRRLQQLFRRAARDAGQKALKPAGELALIHYAAHQVGFHQRRRKKILASGLP